MDTLPPPTIPPYSASDLRAAYSDISVSLHLLDMRGWYWTLADWLRLYEGLEAYLPPEDDPVICTARALCTVAHTPSTRLGAAKVVDALQALAFLRWHVQWMDFTGKLIGEPWQPLGAPSVPFAEFLKNRPVSANRAPRFKKLKTLHVDNQAFRSWLVAGYLRFVSPHRDKSLT
jgi:hypothetical protein